MPSGLDPPLTSTEPLKVRPAYDPVKNRWVVLHFKGRPSLRFNGSMHYDRKRKLLWALDGRGNVKALRIDLEKALAVKTS